MKHCKTYQATIYCGLKEAYNGPKHSIAEVRKRCREYCDAVGLCVSVTSTYFVYTDGQEPGVIVGIINYPRFPAKPVTIDAHALAIGHILLTALRQERLTVVLGENSVLLERTAKHKPKR